MTDDSDLALPHSARPTRRGWPVGYLVLLHVTASVSYLLVGADINEVSVLGGSALILVLSQGSLLGIWLALGHGQWVLRCVTTFAGLLGLWSLVHRTSAEMPAHFSVIIAAAPCCGVAAVLLLIRVRTGIRLERLQQVSVGSAPLHFSIRQVMAGTAIIAVTLSAGRYLGGREVAALIATMLCLAGVPLAVLWGTLGHGRAAVRFPLALLVSALIGLVPPYYLGLNAYLLLWPALSASMGIVIALSLLWLRANGYRLMRRSSE